MLRSWGDSGLGDIGRRHGVDLRGLAAELTAVDERVLRGEVSYEQWADGIAERLAADLGPDTARAVVADWSTGVGMVDAEMLALVRTLRAQVPVVLVSNATTRLERDLDALGLTGELDAVVSSARVGVTKPDPRIYAAAARAAGVPPNRCVFVDDSAQNVAGAQAVGMRGIHYTDVPTLRTALAL